MSAVEIGSSDGGGRRGFGLRLCDDGGEFAVAVRALGPEGERAGTGTERGEGQEGQAGQDRQEPMTTPETPSARRIAGQLARQRLVGGAGHAGLRHHEAAAVETISAGSG